MKSEIKQRLTQLNNGEIPDGYKKTDFGVFPCDWVTDKKLKDIGTFGKGRGIPGDKLVPEGVPCVGYGDIYMKYDHFHFENAKSFVDEETARESQPIKKGTLLFTGTGETAEEIGKCVCYNGDETIYAGGDIITFVSDKVNPLFLTYQQYQSFSLKRKASFGQGHSVVHIHRENLERLNVAFPKSDSEQSKIAKILIKWDEAIELYNRQIEKLKLLKSVCLKKMFPKKGEKVPEWRFRDFTDDWEQRQFGDLGSVAMCKRIFKEETTTEGVVPFYKIGTFGGEPDAFISRELFEEYKAKFSYPEIGDMLISASGTIGRTVEYTGKDEYFQDSNIVWFKHDNRVDNSFLKCLYSIVKWSGIEGSTIKRLYNDNFLKTEFMLPSVDEQKKIGDYFANLDNLITLHQRKVELIQKQRKVLQQYLLNGIVRVK